MNDAPCRHCEERHPKCHKYCEKYIEWRNSLLCGYNNYLGTNFTQGDMYWIYDKLGNAVDHELTLEFIHSGFDLSLVRPKKREDAE